MENRVIGFDYNSYRCEKCDSMEVHHITLYLDGNLYECDGCGHRTDTRPQKMNYRVMMTERWAY